MLPPSVIRRDQAVGADLLFSWLLALLVVLLRCRLLGRAAPRMVYGAARIPPWRRAPPLAHVYVVAVRAAGVESWPRVLLLFSSLVTTSLGSGSKVVQLVYWSSQRHWRALTRMIRVIVNRTRYLFLRKYKNSAIVIKLYKRSLRSDEIVICFARRFRVYYNSLLRDASASGSSGQVVSRSIKAQSQIPSLLSRWLLL